MTDLETQLSVLRINLATTERTVARLEVALARLVRAVREQNGHARSLGDCVIVELMEGVRVLESINGAQGGAR